MSATADIAKYRDYFGDIARDEKVEVVAIPNSNQQTIYQRRVLYLEQVKAQFLVLIGLNLQH